MSTQSKIYAGLAVLVLAILAAWGSRESTYKKQQDTVMQQVRDLTSKLSESEQKVSTLTEQIKKQSHTTTKRVPIQFANGKIAYIEESTADTLDELQTTMVQTFQKQIDQVMAEKSTLEQKIRLLETKTVKSAPLWNVVVGWEPMGVGAYYAGGGINIGAISVSLDNPVALEFRPRVMGMIRF